MRVPTPIRPLVVALTALALIATGCGSGEPDVVVTPAPTAAPIQASPAVASPIGNTTAIIASDCGADLAIPSRPAVSNLSVAVVAPSADQDHAFTQSMTDSLKRLGMDYEITENAFMLDVAAAALEDYAASGTDVVIAHGTQYGELLVEIAPNYPDTSFLWGTSSSTLGLPNVYAYYAEAQQGAYVNGWMAAEIAYGFPIAVVGPFKAGDAVLYVNGFTAGAQANGADGVAVTYTGSFSDVDLAAEAAADHLADGVKVLTGTSQSAVGAVTTAAEGDVPWFGTQSNHEIWSSDTVIASQVYHWEVVLDDMFNNIEAGTLGGVAMSLTLANGGLVIEVNGCYDLSPELLQGAADVIESIIEGSVTPPS